MNKEDYEKIIDDVIHVSEEVDFFNGVPYEQLFMVIKDFNRHILKEGQTIFSKGWDNERVSIILSGRVGIYTEDKVIHTPQGIDIKSSPISILKRGDSIGQIGAMSPLRFPFITKATTPIAEVISFHLDYSKEKEFPQAFLALYKNAFYRLSKSILTISNEVKLKSREHDHAIEAYLSNIH